MRLRSEIKCLSKNLCFIQEVMDFLPHPRMFEKIEFCYEQIQEWIRAIIFEFIYSEKVSPLEDVTRNKNANKRNDADFPVFYHNYEKNQFSEFT